jgi:hypothetical protein
MSKHHQRETCGDCGVEEGEFHVLGCDCEKCPFCFRQLISCDCPVQLVQPFDRVIYEELLRKKGRIPFILYPVMCAKCGELWPELFRVPDEEWKRYIQPDKQRTSLCLDCYEYIKDVITEVKQRAAKKPSNE